MSERATSYTAALALMLSPSASEVREADDLEKYETDMELQLYREYKDVVGIFKYVVETERRFYLCNAVDLKVRTEGGDVYFEVTMADAWVWDVYRSARFVKNAKVVTFRDVNIEELAKSPTWKSRRTPTSAADPAGPQTPPRARRWLGERRQPVSRYSTRSACSRVSRHSRTVSASSPAVVAMRPRPLV